MPLAPPTPSQSDEHPQRSSTASEIPNSVPLLSFVIIRLTAARTCHNNRELRHGVPRALASCPCSPRLQTARPHYDASGGLKILQVQFSSLVPGLPPAAAAATCHRSPHAHRVFVLGSSESGRHTGAVMCAPQAAP